MSQFDPAVMLNVSYEDANSTQYTPVPEGEYNGVIKPLDDKSIRSTDKGQTILDLNWIVDDEGVRAETGLQEPTVRQSIFLDLTPSGGLDFSKGKNVRLGQLRDALGQNTAGKPWSFGMLSGAVARIQVKHRVVDDGTIYTDVKKVSRL